MSKIKSKKAKKHISDNILNKRFNDGELHSCVRAETAVLAIHYAETETEKRLATTIECKQLAIDYLQEELKRVNKTYTKQLQELKDKVNNLSICDIDAPVFTHTKDFKEHFDYIKKCFINELNK